MSSQPFNTTIVRQNERPVSADIDSLQSQLNAAIRDLAAAQYQYNGGGTTSPSGFVGYGFKAHYKASYLGVELTPGIGFQYEASTAGTTTIDGVLGLDDLSHYKPLLLSSARSFATASVSAGKCRRDRLMVKYQRQLTDTSSRYFLTGNPPVFQPNTVSKTMTFDLATADVLYIDATTSLPTSVEYAFVYRTGTEVSYVNDNDFLTAPIPAEDAGYLTIAVINIGPSVSEITNNRIVDYRKPLLANGCATLSGSVQFTEQLATFANARTATPPSMRCILVKHADGDISQTVYAYFLMGDNDSLTVATSEAHAQPVQATWGPAADPSQTLDVTRIGDASSGVVDGALWDVLNDTLPGTWTVLGGGNVAVGAKYFLIKAIVGTMEYNQLDQFFLFNYTALTKPSSTYTFNFSINVQRTS